VKKVTDFLMFLTVFKIITSQFFSDTRAEKVYSDLY